MADRIVVMRDGDIEQIGSPMQIYSDPVTDFVADFFGSPSMNLIAGEVGRAGGAAQYRSTNFSIELPDRLAQVPAGPVTLGIRPEHVRVRRDRTAAADVELPVRLVEPLGKDTLLYFDIGSDRPFVVITEGLSMAEMDAGDRVGLTLTRDCLFLFGLDGRRIARDTAFVAPACAQLAGARG